MPIAEPDVATRAYCAGIIDGEGCIHIGRHNVRGWVGYSLFLKVTSCNRPMLEFLRSAFGVGQLYAINPRGPKNAPAWHWTITTQQAGEVLRLVEPYLIIKRREAVLAAQFLKIPHLPTGGPGGTKKAGGGHLAIKEGYRLRMRQLKRVAKTGLNEG